MLWRTQHCTFDLPRSKLLNASVWSEEMCFTPFGFPISPPPLFKVDSEHNGTHPYQSFRLKFLFLNFWFKDKVKKFYFESLKPLGWYWRQAGGGASLYAFIWSEISRNIAWWLIPALIWSFCCFIAIQIPSMYFFLVQILQRYFYISAMTQHIYIGLFAEEKHVYLFPFWHTNTNVCLPLLTMPLSPGWFPVIVIPNLPPSHFYQFVVFCQILAYGRWLPGALGQRQAPSFTQPGQGLHAPHTRVRHLFKCELCLSRRERWHSRSELELTLGGFSHSSSITPSSACSLSVKGNRSGRLLPSAPNPQSRVSCSLCHHSQKCVGVPVCVHVCVC